MKRKLKKVTFKDTLDEAIIWLELEEKLSLVYNGEYSYTNIFEALAVAKCAFYENLKED